MNKRSKILRTLALGVLLIIFLAGLSDTVNTVRVSSYEHGLEAGYSAALDTMNKIIVKQAKSDTSITKLVIINPDTFTVYLSRKIPLNNGEAN